MTNAFVALMHTTAAYQAAVAQLLIGEANFVGKQLELSDWKPIQTTNEAKVEVHKPIDGLTGTVETGGYYVHVYHGHLARFARRNDREGLNRNQLSLLETLRSQKAPGTNEVQKLALTWLATVGLGSNGVESAVLDKAFQIMHRKLVLTNQAELLGPEPPPDKFVSDMVGGPETYSIITAPTKVEAELVRQKHDDGRLQFTSRRGPVQVKGERAQRISRALGDYRSYEWLSINACIAEYGVRLRFYQGQKMVEILLCFNCFDILINNKPGNMFRYAQPELLKVMREIFPGDAELKKLK
ncbi:MAG: hypothetical protein EBU46_21630, partial [Nitrosomonadaceae bacterium]|nr:hypothetical protein [Nitrosomonadaceae bacterium]